MAVGNGPAPPDAEPPGVPEMRSRWSFGGLGGFITLAAALAYGVELWAHSAFYSEFGVRPEEVGLGYSELVPRAFIGLVFTTVGLFVVGLIFVLLVHLFSRNKNTPATEEHPNEASTTETPNETTMGTHEEGKGNRISRWVKNRLKTHFEGDPWLDKETARTFAELLVILLLALGIAGYAAYKAENDAAKVKSGQEVRQTLYSVTAWRAELMENIHWSGPPSASPDLRHRLLYLGEAGGIAVLFDATAQRTIRLPANLITFSVAGQPPGALGTPQRSPSLRFAPSPRVPNL
jgi:hypothetical protein